MLTSGHTITEGSKWKTKKSKIRIDFLPGFTKKAIFFGIFVIFCVFANVLKYRINGNRNNALQKTLFSRKSKSKLFSARKSLAFIGAQSNSFKAQESLLSIHKKHRNGTDFTPVLRDGDDDSGNTRYCDSVINFRGNQCKFARKNCPEPFAGGFLNYMLMRFCTFPFPQIPLLYYSIAFFWVFFLFYLLKDAAEANFCSSLTVISDALKLSPSVAGVTLLALGNGAPDIASIVAGMFTGSAGFGLGEPIGGGLLVTSVVLGLVVLSADMNVAPVPFFRDVCAYLIANIFVLTTILVFGYFDFITAMICLGIYLAYVIIVILTQSLGSILHKLSRPLRHWLQVKFPNGIVNRLVKKPKKNQPAPVYGHLDAELSSDEDKDDVTTFGWFGFKSTGKKGAHKTFVDMVVDEAKADTTMYMFPKMGLLLKKKADERKKKRAEREALENDADINNPNQSFVHAMEDKTPIIHDHFSLENFENQEQRKVAENAALVSISASSENGINSPAPKNMKENSKTVDSSDSSSSDDSDDEGNAVGEIGSSSLTETGESKIKEFRTLDDAKKEAKERQEAQKKAYFEKVEERSYFERWLIWIGWHDMSLFEKFLYPIMGPTIFLRNLTIPKADPEEYSRLYYVLNPTFIPLLLILGLQFTGVYIGPLPLLGIVLPIGVFFSAVVLFTTKNDKPPFYHFIFVIFSFFMAIIWIYLIANELVDILTTLGKLFEISEAVLGLTVLAIGNSLGDLAANVVVAKVSPQMALTAIFAAPMMNILIGLGLSVGFMTNPFNGAKRFPLEMSPSVICSFFFLLGSLISSMIVVPCNGFKYPKTFGIFLFFLYVVFCVIGIAIELNFIF